MVGLLFGRAKSQAAQQPAVAGLQIQSSVYGKAIPILYGTTRLAPNLGWYGNFKAIAHQSAPPAGGKGGVGGGGGGKGGGGSVTYTYQVDVELMLCEGPIQGVGTVYVDKNITTPAALGMSVFLGSYSQSAWNYLTSNFPAYALGYRGIGYVAAAAYQLGNSPQLPNHNFEVKGVYSNSVSGKTDADPSLVVADLLANAHYGAGFPSARIGDLSTYQNYTLAAGLLVSPAYSEQRPASQILDELAQNTNSAFVWSSGALTLVPYGDQSLSGNGKTYTPPSAPLYDLADDDFMPQSGADPVTMARKRPADALNSIKLEYLDRTNAYNPAIVEAKDQALIDAFGLRQDSSRQAHLFADGTAARQSVQLQLQRQAIRNTYQFTLDGRYILLDPMDIVTLTDAKLGLNRQWVRLIEIDENDDGSLTCTAEEYLDGTGAAALYSFEPGQGYADDYNADPGGVNTPIFYELPVQLSPDTLDLAIWASGGSNWGGADIWISSDGSTYKLAGRITSSSRQGVLSSTLASGTDPDIAHTAHVDLSESLGDLLSGTQQDADSYHTLCYVGGELISYQTATLTSAYHYDLTYLRRGAYGTTIASHAIGTQFGRLNDAVFYLPYDKGKIGTTVYVKFLSFNIWGGGQQSLADVDAFTHTILGPPTPSAVANFQAQQNGNVVVFNWDDIITDVGLKGYDIGFAPQGETDWGRFNELTQAHRGTEMTNASVPPGTWTFGIRAHDIVDNLGPISTADLTVTNPNPLILDAQQAPDWLGAPLSGSASMYPHYSGIMIPISNKKPSDYVPTGAPAAPTLGQVAGGALSGATYYVKITYVDSTGESVRSLESSLAVSTGNLLQVSSPAAPGSGSAVAYNVYAANSSGAEQLQNAMPIPMGSSWTMPTAGLVAGASPPSVDGTGWQTFDIFVPYPKNCQYISPTYDTGLDADVRAFLNLTIASGCGETGSDPVIPTYLYAWLTGHSNTFQPGLWTVGYLTLRYVIGAFSYFPPSGVEDPGNVPYVSGYEIVVDTAPVVENAETVSVSPGGTAITFPTPYHSPPNVVCTVVGSSARYASAASITATSFTAHVFDNTGADVGGTINWQATGT